MRPHKPAKKGRADVDESTDTYDTIDWLLKNVPTNNGRVGMWGISYPGFYVGAGMIDAHPALKAASPQAPIGDWFMGDDFYHNGAFLLAHNFASTCASCRGPASPTPPQARPRSTTARPTATTSICGWGRCANPNPPHFKGTNPFWNINLAHPNYDEFWQARPSAAPQEHRPGRDDRRRLVRRRRPVGPLRTYQAIEQTSPGADQYLVMGPWHHGGWSRGGRRKVGPGHASDRRPREFYREQIELPFFEHTSRGAATKRCPRR